MDCIRVPQRLPNLTPRLESRKVVRAIQQTAGRISTSRKAKVMPTASASMLVATAMANMTRKPREALASSVSPLRASRSMLIPRIASRAKAIQWSMAVMYRETGSPGASPARA